MFVFIATKHANSTAVQPFSFALLSLALLSARYCTIFKLPFKEANIRGVISVPSLSFTKQFISTKLTIFPSSSDSTHFFTSFKSPLSTASNRWMAAVASVNDEVNDAPIAAFYLWIVLPNERTVPSSLERSMEGLIYLFRLERYQITSASQKANVKTDEIGSFLSEYSS